MHTTPPRCFFITASSGIGAATARLLARAQQRIFIVSRTAEHSDQLVCELQALGAEAAYYAADVTQASAVEQAVAQCIATFGRIDGLYNVAGQSGRRLGDGPLHLCTEEAWQTVMHSNTWSQFLVSKAVLAQMLKQSPLSNTNLETTTAHEQDAVKGQRGVILCMGSILAQHPEPRHFATHAYAASKGAVAAMAKSMAAYYAPYGIRINTIAPSLVRTPMSARASLDETIVQYIRHKQPLVEDVIAVEDVAQVSVFLLTDLSRAITGEVLAVDAGWDLV